jgi:hypothetical protein
MRTGRLEFHFKNPEQGESGMTQARRAGGATAFVVVR